MKKKDYLKRLISILLAAIMLMTSGDFSPIVQGLASDTTTEAQSSETESVSDTTTAQTSSEEGSSTSASETPMPETTVEETDLIAASDVEESTSTESAAAETTSETEATDTAPMETTISGASEFNSTEEDTSGTDGETTSPAETSGNAESSSDSTEVNNSGSINLNSLPQLRDGGIVWEFSSTISTTQVTAGDKFTYSLSYNVPTGGYYQSASIVIPLPEGITYTGSYDGTVNAITVRTLENGTTALIITLPATLEGGTASNLSFVLEADNFVNENGAEVDLTAALTATYVDRTSGATTPVTASASPYTGTDITVVADDGWNISKTTEKSTIDLSDVYTENGVQYFNVTYILTAYNQSSTAAASDTRSEWNRFGRLTMESFNLSDILPTNVPAGGEAAGVVSVKVSSDINPNGITLTEGSGYKTTTSGGAVTELDIDYIDTVTAADASKYQYVDADTPVTTTYEVVVKYPYEPYLTASDETSAVIYTPENTAELTYKLLGQNETIKDDTSDFTIGSKKTPEGATDIVVNKYIKYGTASNEVIVDYDSSYGSISFTLYKDAACTIVANSADGTTAAGATQQLSETGTVIFKSLLSNTTYYLKETVSATSGLAGPTETAVEVTTDASGNLTYVNDVGGYATIENNQVAVYNQADSVNIIQFAKKGLNSEGTLEILSGVTFKLEDVSNPLNIYETTSDAKGVVRFTNIPDGTYNLYETSVGANNEYDESTHSTTITVSGGEVAYPDFISTGTSESNVFLNTSPKGKLQILKEDKDDNTVTLQGVTFNIYGPFANSTDADNHTPTGDGMDPKYAATITTGPDGIATSGALTAGYYVVQEISTLGNYVLSTDLTTVDIGANVVEAITLKNERKITVDLTKSGSLDSWWENELAGATYVIYEWEGTNLVDDDGDGVPDNLVKDDSGTPAVVGTLTTRLDSAQAVVSNTVELERDKNYCYVETKAPDGYALDKTYHLLDFSGLAANDYTFTIEATDSASWGQIKIEKKDSNTDSALSGVTFTICYKDNNGVEVVVDTIITDNTGVALSKLIPPGTNYYIKETIPDGYVIATSSTSAMENIVVNDASQTTVKIYNDPLVSLEFTKVDSITGNTLVAGEAGFTLYSDDACTQVVKAEVKTDANGKVTFTGLVPGVTYYFKETYTSDDYVLDDTIYTIEMPPVSPLPNAYTNLTYIYSSKISNDRKGDLIIYKTSNMDGGTKALAGAVFQLYEDAAGTKPVGSQKTTDANGNITWSDLEPGTYYLKEISAEGHDVPTTLFPVYVTAGQNQGAGYSTSVDEIANTANQGKVTIEKVDEANSSTKLAGVTFKIYTVDKSTSPYTYTDTGKTLKTDSDGTATSGWLAPGNYALLESDLGNNSGDYALLEDYIEFSVTQGQTTNLTGINAIKNKQKGKLTLNKYGYFQLTGGGSATDIRYDLTGAKVTLYYSTGTANQLTDIVDSNIVTIDGKEYKDITITNPTSIKLPEGDYWVVETVTPENYTKTQDAYEVTIVTGTEEILGIDNTTKKGKIQITKINAATKMPITGAEFEVYKVATADEIAAGGSNLVYVDEYGYLIKIKASASSDADGYLVFVDSNGEATTIDLDAGTYYLRETKAPNGYFIDNEWTEVTVTEGTVTSVDIDNYSDNTLPGYKYGIGTGTNLTNLIAYFGLFETQEDADAAAAYLKSIDAELDFNARKELMAVLDAWKAETLDTATITDPDLKAVMESVLQVAVSASDGSFEFTDVTPDKEYWIVELVAPFDSANTEPTWAYSYSGTLIQKIKVTVDGNGVITNSLIEFDDPLMGRLEVSKVTNLSGQEYRVEGVMFLVYEAVAGTAADYDYTDGSSYYKRGDCVATGFTDANGIYQTRLLPAGDYIVVEADESYYSPLNSDAEAEAPNAVDSSLLGKETDNIWKILTISAGEINAAEDSSGNLELDHKFTNTAAAGKFILKKIDQASNTLLGATFKVQVWDTTANSGNGGYVDYIINPNAAEADQVVYSFTIDASNIDLYEIYTSIFLPAGKYQLVETQMDGYTLADPLEFTIASGEITHAGGPQSSYDPTTPITIMNHAQAKLVLEKWGIYDTSLNETDHIMRGVSFAVYKDDGTYVETIATGTDGKATSKYLDVGNYLLLELKVDKTYNQDFDVDLDSSISYERDLTSIEKTALGSKLISFTIYAGGTNTELTSSNSSAITNTTRWGKFSVKKEDSVTGADLTGAVFKVYVADSNGTKYTLSDGSPVYLSEYKLNNNVVTLTTGNNGVATSRLLPEGTYYLIETTSPSGYQKVGDGAYGPYTVTANTVTDNTSNPIENDKQFSIELAKTGYNMSTKAYKALDGVTFGIYDTYTDAVAGTNVKDSQTTSIQSGKASVTFSGLITGYLGTRTYYIKELSTVIDYVLSDAVYAVVLYYDDTTGSMRYEYYSTDGSGVLGATPLYDSSTASDTFNLQNEHKGNFTLTKTMYWNGAQTPKTAVFNVYKVSGNGAEPAPTDTAVTSVETVIDLGVSFVYASGTSVYLDAGWYKLVEESENGFDTLDPIWIEVKDNETQTSYTKGGSTLTDTPILNEANKGRFSITKYDGDKSTTLAGAQFELYKYNTVTGKYELLTASEIPDPEDGETADKNTNYITVNKTYTSGLLEPGDYQLIEKVAPVYYILSGETVYFELDSEPITFTITVAETLELEITNDPKGTITLQKLGYQSDNNGVITESKTELNNVTFKLYPAIDNKMGGYYPDTNNEIKAGSGDTDVKISSDSNGNYYWRNIDPGVYIILETAPEHYAENTTQYVVKVEAGQSATANLVYYPTTGATIENYADEGIVIIEKVDDSTGAPLTGAEFKIYAKTDTGRTKAYSVTSKGDGTYISDYLPAASTGTKYILVETKAPNGYTLDDNWQPTETEITVYPILDAEYTDKANNINYYVIENKSRTTNMDNISPQITKTISDADESSKDVSNPINADTSLISAPYTVDFLLGGYGTGANTHQGVRNLIVTDEDLTLQYLDSTNYIDMPVRNDDYSINSITVYPAFDVNGAVTAIVEYHLNGSTSWTSFGQYTLNTTQTIDFSPLNNGGNMVTGVRVRYINVDTEFKLTKVNGNEGLKINVTFTQRDSITSETMHEVRRVVNQAALHWAEAVLNEKGEVVDGKIFNLVSNEVAALIPTRDDELPVITLTNEVTNGASSNYVFSTGSTIKYRVTATNTGVTKEPLVDPILTVVLPQYTTLDESTGFKLILKTTDSSGNTVYNQMDSGSYTITEQEVYAIVGTNASGQPVYSTTVTTTQYVITFADGYELKPGESIMVEYGAVVDYGKPTDVVNLQSPAYLGSDYTIEKTAENPNGTSFKIDNSVVVVPNQDIDDTLGGDTRDYLEQLVSVTVNQSHGIQVAKYISETGESGTWSTTRTAEVLPTDKIYYKLSLYNYSTTPIKTLRLVDILPFNGDSYVISSGTSRGTTIPTGAAYEEMLFENLEFLTYTDSIESYKIYYYVEPDTTTNSWNPRVGSASTDFPFLYNTYYDTATGNWQDWNSTSFGSGYWTTVKPSDAGLITAIGVEVYFKDDALLHETESTPFEVKITMSTPGYPADQIEDYVGKQMINGTAGAVVRQDDKGIVNSIGTDERAESNVVVAELTLPTGSIGDYAFYDNNSNGIQDDSDTPVSNLTVRLYQKVISADGYTEENIMTTTTDGTGYYIFTDLPCNYLKTGATAGSENPSDYVGGKIYYYRVEFDMPEDYSATTRYAGNDTTVDSNIDQSGQTEWIQLFITVENGKPIAEENMTLDAGFIRPFKLGNKVWLDLDRDGTQNTYIDTDGLTKDEPGVNGVMVYLYKVDGPDSKYEDGTLYAQTVTANVNGEDGVYWFSHLPEGYYIVVFDITYLVKPDGYTYQYMFTQSNVPTYRDEFDSDPIEALDADERIWHTEIIHLSPYTSADELDDPRVDGRWDAGLTVYSALGGYTFDDENYTNMQDIYKALPGTTVELYRVIDGIREETPIQSAVTGDDGIYYFDRLIEGQYQVKFTFPDRYTAVEPRIGTETTDSNVQIFYNDDQTWGYTVVIDLERDSVDTTWDAGAYMLSAIGDYAWFDANKNGLQDSDEAGVAGIKVILQIRMDGGTWSDYQTTVTDENGKYIFTGLKSSQYYGAQYRVVFVLEDTMKSTISLQGDNAEIDSNIIMKVAGLGHVTDPIPTIGYGEEDMTWDAGIIVTLGTIGDYVWFDTNRDGLQDEDETGVGDIPVVLEVNPTGDIDNEDAWYVLGETQTNSNGYYLFYDLPSNYYRVRFQIPEEYNVTLANAGTDDDAYLLDSDASREATDRWFYTRIFYLDVDVQPEDLSWDAGIYLPTVTETKVPNYQYNYTPRYVTTTVYRTVNTGDTSNTWIWIAAIVISAAAVAGTLVYQRKKKRKSD